MTHEFPSFDSLLISAVESSYWTAIRLTGNQSDAEDLLHEATLSAIKGRDSFQPGTRLVSTWIPMWRPLTIRRSRHGPILAKSKGRLLC